MTTEITTCNCLALRAAARKITQAYDAALAPSGLTATQFPLLAALARCGPQAMGELAARLGLDRTTLGHSIRPLLAAGWVTASTGQDRRRRELALTAEGLARLRAGWPGWQVAQARFEAAFGAEQAAALRSMLLRVRAAA